MTCLDLTLPSPEENLACDEALLDSCEEDGADEVLRFWEPAEYFVVVGYGNRIEREVNAVFCRDNEIPILRRCTGGGTILQGPGVLNYSLVLSTDPAGPCHSISSANQFILERNRAAVAPLLGRAVEIRGQTDLAIDGKKFSGNSQRRRKEFLLFHGSFLLGFDIALVERALPMPSQQPDYRDNRRHSDFLMNQNVAPAALKSALVGAWQAFSPLAQVPFEKIRLLAATKYSSDQWTFRS